MNVAFPWSIQFNIQYELCTQIFQVVYSLIGDEKEINLKQIRAKQINSQLRVHANEVSGQMRPHKEPWGSPA